MTRITPHLLTTMLLTAMTALVGCETGASRGGATKAPPPPPNQTRAQMEAGYPPAPGEAAAPPGATPSAQPPPAGQGGAYEPIPANPSSAPPAAGNAPAPPQPQAQPQARPEPQPSAPAGENTYTVRKGDTLWKIAQRHYGNGQMWVRILDANPGLNPQKLPVGKTITLP